MAHGFLSHLNFTSCPPPKNAADLLITPVPVVGIFTTQNLMFIIAIACAAATAVISLTLMMRHLCNYTKPDQQRQIMRIIFTPCVFAVVNACAILDYRITEYLTPLTDLYECFAIGALFLLFVDYVAPGDREAHFLRLENWKAEGGKLKPFSSHTVLPGGSLRWYQGKHVAVFCYIIVIIIMTITWEASQATNDYCPTSFSPRFAHLWVVLFKNVALVLAVVAILTFYSRLSQEHQFMQHKPLLKLISFKLIIGVTFIQGIIFQILIGRQVIKGSPQVTGLDIVYGIPSLLIAVEQVFFSLFFHYSFGCKKYQSKNMNEESATNMQTKMNIFKAAANALNPADLILGCIKAVRLLTQGITPFSKDDPEDGYQHERLTRPSHQGPNEIYFQPVEQHDEQYPKTSYDGGSVSTAYNDLPQRMN